MIQIHEEITLPSSPGHIMICTMEAMMSMLHSDANLSPISHIVVDDIDKRDPLIDTLLIVIQDLIRRLVMDVVVSLSHPLIFVVFVLFSDVLI